MFTRNEFEIACKALEKNMGRESPHLKGWNWREHPVRALVFFLLNFFPNVIRNMEDLGT